MSKPGAPTSWASNTNYAGGPRVGTPTRALINTQHKTDGWWPDEKPSAQQQNQWNWEVWVWLEWVFDGSSAGAEDAHIVETDSGGIATLAKLICTGQAAGSLGVQSSGTTSWAGGAFAGGPTNGPGVQGTGGGTGIGVQGTGGSGGGDGVFGAGQGGGDGVVGQGDGAGVGGNFTGGPTNATGVTGVGQGTGLGGSFLGGAGGAEGVLGVGQGGGDGVVGTGNGTGVGVSGTGGGSSGSGVSGTGGSANGHGVVGSGTGTGTGIVGLGLGTGTAIKGEAVNGYGVVAQSDTSSPQAAAFRLVPQDDDPDTLEAAGDVIFNSTTDDMRIRDSAGWKGVWVTPNGFYEKLASFLGDSTTDSSSDQTKVTNTVNVPADANYDIHFSCQVLLAAGTATTERVKVKLKVNGTTEHECEMDFAALGQDKIVSGFHRAALTVAGNPHAILLTYANVTGTGGEDVTIRKAKVGVYGAYA